jgi:hypothetical protein
MLARLFALAALVFALAAPPALADDPAPPPEARALIQKQLDAFAHDDAAGAYALAAPGIKAMFPDADTFLSMVKSSYAPVYRHRSVEFGAAAMQGDAVRQALTIVDSDNQVWTAVYMLEKQPDGGWATAGCVLTKSEESSL